MTAQCRASGVWLSHAVDPGTGAKAFTGGNFAPPWFPSTTITRAAWPRPPLPRRYSESGGLTTRPTDSHSAQFARTGASPAGHPPSTLPNCGAGCWMPAFYGRIRVVKLEFTSGTVQANRRGQPGSVV